VDLGEQIHFRVSLLGQLPQHSVVLADPFCYFLHLLTVSQR
jgi:hypothetical protein